MGEENTFNVKANIIRADVTFSLQLPKLAFLFAENTEFVGEWEVLDIQLSEDGIEEMETNYEMLEIEQIRSLIKPRKQFAHKGNFGHALLIAGSKGMAGASVLAARACLRSGVGLLTVHAPMCNNDILQTSIPEAIVETDINETCFAVPTDTDDYQAVGIGPGWDETRKRKLLYWSNWNIARLLLWWMPTHLISSPTTVMHLPTCRRVPSSPRIRKNWNV